MCGRYVLAEARLAENAFALADSHWQYEVSYRVLPTDTVPVVVCDAGVRTGVMMRWGLIPYFERGVPPTYSTINATVERVQTAPAYRGPWERDQRCILAMRGFYEPHVNADGSRDPYYVHLPDRDVFGIAGLWDRSRRDDGSLIYSCTLITLPANRLLAEVHNEKKRMPAILSEKDHGAWLTGTKSEAQSALKPYADELMSAWKVSRQVNSPKFPNESSLIAPIDK